MKRLRSLATVAIVALVCWSACSDDPGAAAPDDGDAAGDAPPDRVDPDADLAAEADTPAVEAVRLESGSGWIEVRPDEAIIALGFGDEERLVLPADALQLGLVDSIRDSVDYNPYGFLVDDFLHRPPPLERWLEVELMVVEDASDEQLEVGLALSGEVSATLAIAADRLGGFRLSWRPDAANAQLAYYRVRVRPDPEEGLYGLGEVFDEVDHRGSIRAMQLELDDELEGANNEAHVPVPLLIGTTGWGLFVQTDYPAAFDVAATDPERVDAMVGTGAATGDGLTVHLFAAEHALDVTRFYYEVTGYPVLPAPWALGPWIWRDENDDQAQVVADANTIRDLDLATSALWIDRPYASGVNSFDFASDPFPDPAAMVDELHALGFRLAIWHTPYLDDEDDATAALRADAESAGYFPPETGPLLNGWGRPIDFTNPDAVDWWQEQLGYYVDLGVEGFKLDYGEDIATGLLGQRSGWAFFDGRDDRTMHAGFQRVYHATYAELLPETGGFILARGGTWGDQANVSVIWPGDIDANFARHGETVERDGGDDYVAVGGLPAAVTAALSLGPSGFPLFASDTGGYRHSPPDKETFTRWFQFSALAPVMQIGTSTNDVAWEPTEANGFDEEMLGWYREYTRLHLRLFPYLWTYVMRVQSDGRPIQRALGLAYPELGVHPSDTYLLGDHLLVAPVIERGARERTLHLPPGSWVDWWSGESHEGPGPLTIDAPLERLPLFLQAGALVPLLRPTIDSLSPTTAPERVDSYATSVGRLYVVTTPGPRGLYELFDGTVLSQITGPHDMSVTVLSGARFIEGAWLEIVGFESAPSSVMLADETLSEQEDVAALEDADTGWVFTAERGGTLHVKVPSQQETTVSIAR